MPREHGTPPRIFKIVIRTFILLVGITMTAAAALAIFSDPGHPTEDERRQTDDRRVSRCIAARLSQAAHALDAHGPPKGAKDPTDCAEAKL
jgi:hypothetical protein